METRDDLRLATQRMELIAGSAALLEADLAGRRALAVRLGASVPEAWPPEHLDEAARRFARDRLLQDDSVWWTMWYLVLRESSTLVGVAGFAGASGGEAVLGYSVLEEFQRRGLATEACHALIQWAFRHEAITAVVAETYPHVEPSLRVLIKLGFVLAGPGTDEGTVRYRLPRPALGQPPAT